MNSQDLNVISRLAHWLQLGQHAWLCTVIHTWGSAPRMPGSLLGVNQVGDVIGSLSGGCIEDDLIEQIHERQLATDCAQYILYGESQQDQQRFKLPCGGTIGVLVEPFTPAHQHIFRSIETAIKQGQNILREYNWQSRQATVTLCDERIGVNLTLSDSKQAVQFKHVYGPVSHLFIIGVCEVSRALAQFALATDFKVTVCDPRAELTAGWDIDNTTVITAMPDDAIAEHIDANSAIVAVTHDPRIDDMGLMDAFATDAFYIGAMGSIKTSENRRQRLLELGVDKHQLERLHAPIGLDIRSKTPAEIAIAIIAQLIQIRAEHTKHG